MEWFFITVGVFIFFLILSGIKIINQYERGVVLTLGAYSYTLNPGLNGGLYNHTPGV